VIETQGEKKKKQLRSLRVPEGEEELYLLGGVPKKEPPKERIREERLTNPLGGVRGWGWGGSSLPRLTGRVGRGEPSKPQGGGKSKRGCIDREVS